MFQIIVEMYEQMKNLDFIEKCEEEVNKMEVENETFSVKILALHQPEAVDLRRIITAIKINNDLERIADHIQNISRDLKFLSDKDEIIKVSDMIDKVKVAFLNALDAYKSANVLLAKQVLVKDSEIDDLRNQLVSQLVKFINLHPAKVEKGLKTLNIIQNLERIADLSTNICEDVIFLIEGKIFKHGIEI
jgi:phosphate transport system protein